MIMFFRLASNFAYNAVTLNLSELTGNPYLNVLLSGATELPACFVAYFAVQRLGRRPAVCGCLLLAGMISFASIPFDSFTG